MLGRHRRVPQVIFAVKIFERPEAIRAFLFAVNQEALSIERLKILLLSTDIVWVIFVRFCILMALWPMRKNDVGYGLG